MGRGPETIQDPTRRDDEYELKCYLRGEQGKQNGGVSMKGGKREKKKWEEGVRINFLSNEEGNFE